MPSYLIVDDSRVSREVIKVYLAGDGVTLLEAKDGEEALVVAKRESPDAVVCDMRMPKLDGPGLCRAMAADSALAQIPVIILTGQTDSEAKRTCLEAGAREVLGKPVDPTTLLESVRRHAKAT